MDGFAVALSMSPSFVDFAARPGNGAWPRLNRADIASGILERVNNPLGFSQLQTSFCGPASFFRIVATDMPGIFAQFAMDLYETGEGTIVTKKVSPRKWVRWSAPMGN